MWLSAFADDHVSRAFLRSDLELPVGTLKFPNYAKPTERESWCLPSGPASRNSEVTVGFQPLVLAGGHSFAPAPRNS